MFVTLWLTILLSIFSSSVFAVDSLSYSGRLVNANGSPVTGPVNLQFKLSYTNAPTVAICTKTINNVALANGVFHTKLDFNVAECGGTLSLQQVLVATPVNESVAIQVTDLSHSKAYSYQAVHSVPTSLVAVTAKTLDQNGAATGEYLKWNGTKWIPAPAGTGSGSVTQIDTGTGLSGGPITTTGTISIANGGVDTAQLANSAVTDAKVAVGANIDRAKLAAGTPNYVLVNDGAGVMSGVASLPVGQGGTGATTVPGIWTVLGLGTAAGKDVGNNIGNVMAADVVPSCFPHEKLQMSLAPFFWTCVTDANTDTTKLPLAGGTMTGDIDLDGNQILNLSAPIVGSDAANKTYVDAAVTGSVVWGVTAGNAHRASGNVGVGTTTPNRNVEILNTDANEALLISRSSNAADEATIGFFPSGANSTTNQSWKVGLPVNSNNLAVSAFDGASTTNVLLLSPVGMVIPRLTTTERDAVATPANGSQIYNTSTNELNYFNGTAWKALGVAGAGVTSLVAGTGLTGGTITSSGTIAVDVGTGPNQIVQLDGSSKLPAVDGSALTNLTPANLSAPVPITKGGTGLSANGAANTLVGMNNAGNAMEYKAITGTGVTVTNGAGTMNFAVTGAPPIGAASGDLSGTYPSPSVVAIQGTPVSAGPTSGNILLYNGSAYAPTAVSGDATISSAGAVTLATVPIAKGGTGVTSLTGKGIVSVNAAGTGLVSTVCGNMEVLSFNGSGDAGCSPISSLVTTSFIQNGNSFGAAAVLGTNDNNSLSFETNATTKMTILPSGEVGIGTASPLSTLDILAPAASIRTMASDASLYSELAVSNNGGSATSYFRNYGTSAAGTMLGNPTANSAFFFANANTLFGVGTMSAAPLVLGTSNTERMRILSNGNVGIGTSTPTNRLSIEGSGAGFPVSAVVSVKNTDAAGNARYTATNSAGKSIHFNMYGTGFSVPSLAGKGGFGSDTGIRIFSDSVVTSGGSSDVEISAGGYDNVGLIVKSTGNVGMGNSSPAQKLQVKGAVAFETDNSINYVSIKSPNSLAATYALTLPPGLGSAGQVLTTDAAGVLSWTTAATSSTTVGGDLSGSISNAQLVANAVGTAEIADSSVTYAKLNLADGDIPFAKVNMPAGTTADYYRGDKTWQPLITTVIPEGTNYYFTDARVSAALMSSYATGTAIPLAPTDTLNQALGKLEAQIIANNTAVSGLWSKTGSTVYYNSGNVGIGTSTPNAKLEIANPGTSGALDYNLILKKTNVADANNSAVGMLFSTEAAGSNGKVGIAHERTATYGMGKLHFLLNGAADYSNPTLADAKMTIQPDGNVGIGTTTPVNKLDVVGAVGINSGYDLNFYAPAGSPDDAGDIVFRNSSGTEKARIFTGNAAGGLFFSGASSPSQDLVITNASNVGIGTSTPSRKLDVAGLIQTNAGVIYNNGKMWDVSNNGTSLAINETGVQAAMTFLAGGNVGVGTVAPIAKLDVAGAVKADSFFFPAPIGDPSPVITSRVVPAGQGAASEKTELILFHSNDYANGSGVDQITLRAPGISFQTYADASVNDISNPAGYNERMYITPDGNVGIGTTGPSEKLEVIGNVKAVSFISTSDRRLKTNLKKVDGLQNLKQITGYRFDWKNSGETEYGIMAQDVEKVMPEAVLTDKKTGLKSVKYNGLFAPVIEAVKELYAQVTGHDKVIKQQAREIASLKKKNDELENRLNRLEKLTTEQASKKK